MHHQCTIAFAIDWLCNIYLHDTTDKHNAFTFEHAHYGMLYKKEYWAPKPTVAAKVVQRLGCEVESNWNFHFDFNLIVFVRSYYKLQSLSVSLPLFDSEKLHTN